MAAILLGDCLEVLRTLEPNSVDACVTDPPYHLTTGKKGGTGEASASLDTPAGRARVTTGGFMGAKWDGGDVAHNPDTWREVLRVLKPGGHLIAFAGSRTYHRMACAIEDAGFEIRDQLMWIYGSGFPKSLDVSKAIDKAVGAKREVIGVRTLNGYGKGNAKHGQQQRLTTEFAQTSETAITDAARQWQGWGTALKPAHEPIVLARKPLIGTVAANVQQHGCGGLNIDGCRIDFVSDGDRAESVNKNGYWSERNGRRIYSPTGVPAYEGNKGRWPANVLHDGSEEVTRHFPQSDSSANTEIRDEPNYKMGGTVSAANQYTDGGSAARFFYSAKAAADDRDEGLEQAFDILRGGSEKFDSRGRDGTGTLRQPLVRNPHPTVKPTDVMRWLVRLVTPPGGTVLDPFAGSGSTGKAAVLEGFDYVLIERDPTFHAVACARVRNVETAGPLFAEPTIKLPRELFDPQKALF